MKPNSFWINCFKKARQSYVDRNVKFLHLNNFSGGENTFLLSKKIINEANIGLKDLNNFPDPSCQMIKSKIADVFHVPSTCITIGNGSDEIIENIPRIFLEPNEEILTITPTFFRFIEASKKMKAKVLTILTSPKDKFRFTSKVIKNVCTVIKKRQPKIIWLCSPNNPTGAVMSLKQIEKIILISKNLIIVDEAFQEFVDPQNKKSAIRLIKQHKNLIVIRTFSKAWGLPGIRFGFAISNPCINRILEKWRLPFNTNIFAQKVIISVLNNFHQLQLALIARETENNRRWLFMQIKKLSNLEIGADSKSNLFILRHKSKDLFKELLKRNILAADFRQEKGIQGMGFVRITIQDKPKNIKLLSALKSIN